MESSIALIQGIYFDGRKDQTICNEKCGKTYRRATITEEHYTILSEPGSLYMGHVSPQSGSAEHISISILKFVLDKNIETDNVIAIGCDGTVINTGVRNGVIRKIETDMGKPLQWLICQLHSNELPLRHLLQNLDGKTAGPTAFTGPIGKNLTECEKHPVTKFAAIICEPLPHLQDLSTDQEYLYKIHTAIRSGECSAALAANSPGKLSHSRWLTAANRILRLYVSSVNPSQNLLWISHFIMKVYAPMWFAIKCKSSFENGAKHIFDTIRLSREFPSEVKDIIDPIIKRNSYFAHPENMLVAMLYDERIHIRELSLRRILKSRKAVSNRSIIREFKVPSLNFDANDYIDLIDWSKEIITSPPVMQSFSDEEIIRMIKSKNIDIKFPSFPCHTQSVERCVKLVTEASQAVCGQDNRDGYIFNKKKSRSQLSHFNTKGEFSGSHKKP